MSLEIHKKEPWVPCSSVSVMVVCVHFSPLHFKCISSTSTILWVTWNSLHVNSICIAIPTSFLSLCCFQSLLSFALPIRETPPRLCAARVHTRQTFRVQKHFNQIERNSVEFCLFHLRQAATRSVHRWASWADETDHLQFAHVFLEIWIHHPHVNLRLMDDCSNRILSGELK